MSDGQIDYSRYTRQELLDVVDSIDRARFPLNHANAQRELDARPNDDQLGDASCAHDFDISNDSGRRIAYAAFAQDPYYLEVWRHLLKGESKQPEFNWFAAIFGMTWCFFRKMYQVGAIVLVLSFVVGILVGVAYVVLFPEGTLSDRDLGLVATGLILLLVGVPFGFLANKMYFNHATAAIQETLGAGLNGNAAVGRLRTVGGTSLLGLVVAISINVAIRFLAG